VHPAWTSSHSAMSDMRLWLRSAFVLICLGVQSGIGTAHADNTLVAPFPASAQPALVAASAAELVRLNAEILRHPQDTALNLHYAAVAESLGERRLALAAYERILIYDPQNLAALEGVDRIRRGLQPNTTQYRLALGALYESNPTYAPSGMAQGEGQAFANLNVRDERTVGDVRWRTLADINGIVHGDQNELNYGYAGASTGPIWELLPGVQINPALGAGASYFDDHFFYGEVNASTTFEAYPNGAYESVRVRAAFRDYDTFFVPEQIGGYLDAVGKFTIPLSIPDMAFSLSPWLRWASIKGSLGAVANEVTIQPGDYTEIGGQLNGYYSVHDWIIFGANIAVSGRYYWDEVVVGATNQRQDTTVSPGASIIFPHVFQYQNTLRFDYTYIHDDSNDPTKSFDDNIVTVTAIRNF